MLGRGRRRAFRNLLCVSALVFAHRGPPPDSARRNYNASLPASENPICGHHINGAYRHGSAHA
jgi:hypothetical protein